MIISILLIVIGMVLVLWGADRLTDGAVAIAKRSNGRIKSNWHDLFI